MPQTVTSTVLSDRLGYMTEFRSVSTMFCKDARAAFPFVLKWKHTGRSHGNLRKIPIVGVENEA